MAYYVGISNDGLLKARQKYHFPSRYFMPPTRRNAPFEGGVCFYTTKTSLACIIWRRFCHFLLSSQLHIDSLNDRTLRIFRNLELYSCDRSHSHWSVRYNFVTFYERKKIRCLHVFSCLYNTYASHFTVIVWRVWICFNYRDGRLNEQIFTSEASRNDGD